MPTVHIAIGNSDDKLSQLRWSCYVRETVYLVRKSASSVWGVWFSAPDVEYQNCCISFEIKPDLMRELRAHLLILKQKYDQDSVALNVSETEFV